MTMINACSLHTTEIDVADLAVADILGQLEKFKLLRYSVGILACHYDAVASGVVEGLGKSLPFPLIGFTTFYQAVPGASGHFELTITVITSDDVRFATCYSNMAEQSLASDTRVRETYLRGAPQGSGVPSLAMSFLTTNRPVTGDEFLRLLDDVTGGVPCFGCATTGDEDNGDNMYVICDGQVFNEGFALLLFYGNVQPRFYVGNYLEEFLLEASAEVTEAEGVVVHRLNGQPATTYLARCGIEMTDESRPGLVTIPILHKRPGEDMLVARTMVDFDNTGSATFFGEIPVGSTFRMAACGADDILESTRASARRAVEENPDAGLMLLFSCIGRYISLGLGTGSELECATDLIPKGVPYLAGYVSGEICPVTSGDRLVNRYHNSSFIVCTLR